MRLFLVFVFTQDFQAGKTGVFVGAGALDSPLTLPYMTARGVEGAAPYK
jgi:hypothetical protein